MSGNVWEWTALVYRDTPDVTVSWRENADSTTLDRVLRGGSYFREQPDYRDVYRGLRGCCLCAP